MYHVVIATRVVFFKCTFECVIYEFWGFRCSSDGKESTCSAGDLGLIPGSGRSPGEGKGYPLQYSCLENPMDRWAWWSRVHVVAELDTTEWLLGRRFKILNMACEALLTLSASPLSSHSGLLPQGLGKCCFLDLKCYALTQPSKALASYPLLSLPYLGISFMSLPQRFSLTSIEFCELSLCSDYYKLSYVCVIFKNYFCVSPTNGKPHESSNYACFPPCPVVTTSSVPRT